MNIPKKYLVSEELTELMENSEVLRRSDVEENFHVGAVHVGFLMDKVALRLL
jgi:hypothetical protein